MASCEKCWRDAGGDPDTYSELIRERKDNPCTPEQQAGYGGECPSCKRLTVHRIVRECVICGCKQSDKEDLPLWVTDDSNPDNDPI